MMKTKVCIWGTVLVLVFLMGCGGPTLPEKFEVALTPAKGYEGAATGKAVIDTKTGTDITIDISGLKPDGLYTAFFVNIKSKMFEGVGSAPHVLAVDASGNVSYQGKNKKDSYKRFTKLGIYLNFGDTPAQNPVGVKAKLGALMKGKKPKMVLVGKLR
ncbi:MAG: hypothetical protein JRF71_15620 [Deltaproteobacteria bacterium]|nr:hypothetical protein [Deltaproteobacteria bacterium]